MELRPEVKAFAEAMEAKLRKHDKDRGDSWRDNSTIELYGRLKQEINEFVTAVFTPTEPDHEKRVLDEGADAANFILFLVDVCGGLKADG